MQNHMKFIYKSMLLLIVTIAMAAVNMSCQEEDLPNNGEPSIKYVRITDPASGDSLLVSAGQGSLIAIVGENLQGASEIWFNDQKAILTPTYITNKTILVTVPSMIPAVIDNKMKIIFSNGRTLSMLSR
jgi:hypothetical protein